MSEGVTYKRIHVARVAREFPQLLAALESGRVHLTGLYVLGPHLTAANVQDVLARASGMSKRSIQPLAPARYHVSFTASAELKKNLDKAKELAGFGVQVDELIGRAMELLVADLEKKRLGVAGRKSTTKVAGPGAVGKSGRYIAKAIRREVFQRDQGQCSYVDVGGRRCGARINLHFDHMVPHARGGTSTAANLRLRGGPHNQMHADECFGPLFMEGKRSRPAPA